MRLNRLFLLIPIVFWGYSCKNDLPLGGDELPTKVVIKIDTLDLPGLSTNVYKDYSGNQTFMTVGKVNDLTAGEIAISTVFLPRLIPFSTGIDTISTQAQYKLRMILTQTFGDTTATNEWDIYKVTRTWRANEWNYDSIPALEAVPVGSFILPANADTFLVDLPSSFATEYHTYYYQETSGSVNASRKRDSLYKANVFGFSFVPRQSGSIKMFRASDVQLRIIETDTTYSSAMSNYANSIQVVNPVDYSNSEFTLLDSYNSQFINFDIDVENNDSLRINGTAIRSKNLSKIEIAFYTDTTFTRSQRVPTFRSLGSDQLVIFESELSRLSDELLLNRPTFAGIRKKNDYKINITSFVNSFLTTSNTSTSTEKFYLTVRGNDGYYTNLLVYNQRSAAYYPRLILTYAVTETN